MDDRKKFIRNQFRESVTQLVDQGLEVLSREDLVELLEETLTDLDPNKYRYTCRFSNEGGDPTVWLEYRTAMALDRDMETLVDVCGLMVELDSTPPLMEDLDIAVTGEGIDQKVRLGGRAVHADGEEVAIELFPPDDDQRRQLGELVETLSEAPTEVQEANDPGSTFTSVDEFSSSVVDEEDSVVDEEDSAVDEKTPASDDTQDDKLPIVDQLIDHGDDIDRRWNLARTDIEEMLLEVATVDDYAVLALESGGETVQYVIHFGQLVDVRRESTQQTEQALAELLQSTGRIDAEDLERANVLASIHDIPVQDALVDMGCITLEDLLRAIRGQLIEEFHQLWEMDTDDARLFRLDDRPPLRLRRSSVDLVTQVSTRIKRQIDRLSGDEIEERKKSFSGGRVQRPESIPFDVDRLGFDEDQRRFFDVVLDEPRSLFDLGRISNLRSKEMIRVLLWLDELGILARRERSTKTPEHQEIVSLYNRLDSSNHFEVLGVHWAAYGDEIDEAYQRLQRTLDVSQNVEEALSDELTEIRQTVSEAYGVLSNTNRRRTYRKKVIDDFSRKNGLDIYRSQIDSLMMRDDKTELIDSLSRIVELDPGDKKARQQLEALRHAQEQNS